MTTAASILGAQFLQFLQKTQTFLCIPSYNEWSLAFSAAAGDTVRAGRSTGQFLFLTLRPMMILLYTLGRLLLHALYRMAGPLAMKILNQGQLLFQRYIAWQMSLSPREILMEMAVLGSIVLLYQLYRFMLRQTFTKRFALWYRKRRAAVGEAFGRVRQRAVKLYTDSVDRISQVSVFCGVLLPHMLFILCSVSLRRLAPSVVKYLANETMLTVFLSSVFPMLCSVLLIHDWKSFHILMQKKQEKRLTPRQNASNEKPGRKSTASMFSRTHPSARKTTASKDGATITLSSGQKSQRNATEEQHGLEERLQFWKDYWVVYAAMQLIISTLYAIPVFGRLLSTLTRSYSPALRVLELFTYVWFYILPYMLVTNNERLEGRPLRVLGRSLGPLFTSVVNSISSVVSRETWNTYIMTPATPFLQLAVTMRLMAPSTRDHFLLVLEQAQQLVVPFVWLLLPLPSASLLAVLYIQYILPLATSFSTQNDGLTTDSFADSGSKTSPNKGLQRSSEKSKPAKDVVMTATPAVPAHRWSSLLTLQYWVLNTLLNALIGTVTSFLWWVPFINVATFAIWWYLSLSTTVNKWYGVLERDLQLLGILSRHADMDKDSGEDEDSTPALYRALCWVLHRLPNAAERRWEEGDGEQLTPVDEKVSSNDATPSNDPVVEVDVPDSGSEIELYTGSYDEVSDADSLESLPKGKGRTPSAANASPTTPARVTRAQARRLAVAKK